jgi:hypothetical protein
MNRRPQPWFEPRRVPDQAGPLWQAVVSAFLTVEGCEDQLPGLCHSDFGEVLPLDDSRGDGPLLYWPDW